MHSPFSVGIIGSGPGSVYCALRLLRRASRDIRITFYERLPQSFGLVRWGVAPDNVAVRCVARRFETQLCDSRVSVVHNAHISSLDDARLAAHDCIVVGVGAAHDKRLEGVRGNEAIIPSSQFVAWYAGHPEMNGPIATSIRAAVAAASHVCIVGNGNVALDICRLLVMRRMLTAENVPDMPHEVREFLREECNGLRRVTVCGRRGPFQAAFGVGELREVLRWAASTKTLVRVEAAAFERSLQEAALQANGDARNAAKMTRLQALWRSVLEDAASKRAFDAEDSLKLDFAFYREPLEVLLGSSSDSVHRVNGLLTRDTRQNANCQLASGNPSLLNRIIDAEVVVSAVGFCVHNVFNLPMSGGHVTHAAGRVRDRLYVTGWCKTGPVGALAATMASAHETADTILRDAFGDVAANK